MKVYYLLGLLMCLTTPLYGGWKKISCSKSKLKLVHINGIETPDLQARQEALLVLTAAQESFVDKEGVESLAPGEIPLLYNQTDGAARDLVKSFYFKVKEAIVYYPQIGSKTDVIVSALTFYPKLAFSALTALGIESEAALDILTFKDRFIPKTLFQLNLFTDKINRAISVGDKVMIVSHSGGTLFANQIIRRIDEKNIDPKLKGKLVASLALGPATSYVPANSSGEKVGNYILTTTDRINHVTSLAPNILVQPQDEEYQDPDKHFIQDTYLNNKVRVGITSQTMLGLFKEKLATSAEVFADNSDKCCGIGTRGYMWHSDECTNFVCLDGYREESVKGSFSLSPDSLVIKNSSKICGNVVLNPSGSDGIQIEGGSTVDGTIKIEGDVRISNAAIEARDRTHESADYSEIKGKVTINDSSVSEGDGTHESARFKIDAGSDEIKIENQSALLGSVELKSKASLNQTTMHGKVKAENAQLFLSVFTNNYFGNDSKPGIQIKKNSCSDDLSFFHATVSDELSVNSCGSFNDTETSGNIVVSGNVFIHGVKLEGDPYSSSQSPMKIEANTTGESGIDGIVLVNNVTIKNHPHLKGNLTVVDATIEEGGKYEGTGGDVNGYFVMPLILGSQSEGWRPTLKNNTIKGTYSIKASLDNVTVDGNLVPGGPDDWTTMSVYKEATVGSGVTLKGLAGISGEVSGNTEINGYGIGGVSHGIGISNTASVEDGSRLNGSMTVGDRVTIKNSTVSGTAHSGGYPMSFSDTTLTNTNIGTNPSVGTYGQVTFSSITGGSVNAYQFKIMNSNLNNATVIGTGTILCNGAYNGGNYNGGTYGSDHDCNEPPPKKSSKNDAQQELDKKRKQMIAEHKAITKLVRELKHKSRKLK